MIQKHPNFNKLVGSFISYDELRDAILKPIYYDSGWVASTDSYSLLWFKSPDYKDREDVHQYSKGQGANAESVLSMFTDIYLGDKKPIGKIALGDIETILNGITMMPEYKDKYKTCSECDGYGVIECDCCGHENECSECDGDGEIKCGKEEEGTYRYPTDECVKINGTHFSYSKMRELIDRLSIVDVKELNIYEHYNEHRIFFSIPDSEVYILMMALYDGETMVKVHNIEIKEL